MPLIRLIDLEQGLPSADEAKRRLQEAIEAARQDRVRVLKVIHGYGSTGSGGRLRISIRAALRIAKQCGDIKLFVTGEDWPVSDDGRSCLLVALARFSQSVLAASIPGPR